ncbi:hypothetical protein SDC9_135611 [bioreactor metagenome]|uniref:Uncharacterized protein n=1 Tax=bioreactor metagenome TaxID=1076179 RepID=A0A645DGW8_9ZZZZ
MRGNPGGVSLVVYEFSHAVMYLVGKIVVEVVRLNGEARMHLLVRLDEKLVEISPVACGYGNDRYAEPCRQLFDVYPVSVLFDLVHEVKCHYHRPLKLKELHREIQVSFKVRRVHYIYYSVRVLTDDKISCYYLLRGVRRKRVYTRQIDYCHALVAELSLPLFFLDRDARPVADILVRSRQSVEQRRLTAVGVAGERHFPLVCVVFIRIVVVRMFARLVYVGIRHAPLSFPVYLYNLCVRGLLALSELAYLYFRGVGLSQRQLIATQRDLQRVSHGRSLDERDLGSGRKAHIYEPASYLPASADKRQYDSALTHSEVFQRIFVFVNRVHKIYICSSSEKWDKVCAPLKKLVIANSH